MRIAALLLVVGLVTGCSHAAIAVSSGAPSVAATTVATGATGATIAASGGAAVALVLTLGTLEYINNPQPFPNPMSLVSVTTKPVPEMASGRRVTEVDCSKPVDLSYGNLKCK
jgi:hypothetical protein